MSRAENKCGEIYKETDESIGVLTGAQRCPVPGPGRTGAGPAGTRDRTTVGSFKLFWEFFKRKILGDPIVYDLWYSLGIR